MSGLLDPIHVSSLRLKNRLVLPPMATGKARSDGRIGQELIDYYAKKAEGGYIGLIISEHCYVSAEGRARLNQVSVEGDETLDGLARLAEAIHRSGSACALQINHAGSATTEEVTGSRPFGPSALPNPKSGTLPREISRFDIAVIVAAFAAAARRAKTAGFDAVELHAAHGYLLSQFLSPLLNARTDDYGGDLEGRMHIHLDAIRAIRAAIGFSYPLFVRLGVSDFLEGGLTAEDGIKAASAFEAAGADLIDVSGGLAGYMVPGLSGQGYFAPYSRAIKAAGKKPVIVTGGVTEAEAADRLVAEGSADLVGVGRAIAGDSQWARRAVELLRNR